MRYLSRKVVLVVACFAAAGALLSAQAPAQKPSFEVASIKPNKSGKPLPTVGSPLAFLPGGRFTATNVTLVDMIVQAYRTRRIQMQGGPNWIDSERFDIVAKADEAEGKLTGEQMREMLQACLKTDFSYGSTLKKGNASLCARPRQERAQASGAEGGRTDRLSPRGAGPNDVSEDAYRGIGQYDVEYPAYSSCGQHEPSGAL